MPQHETLDTANDYLLGALPRRSSTATGMVFSFAMPPRDMTPDQALRAAAWLVALAEPMASHSFADVLEAVRQT